MTFCPEANREDDGKAKEGESSARRPYDHHGGSLLRVRSRGYIRWAGLVSPELVAEILECSSRHDAVIREARDDAALVAQQPCSNYGRVFAKSEISRQIEYSEAT